MFYDYVVTKPVDLLPYRTLPVHVLAEQEFCELKVDYELRNSHVKRLIAADVALAVQNEKRQAGRRVHAAMASDAVPVTEGEGFGVLESGESVLLREWPLRGKYRTIAMAGRPDVIYSDSAGAIWILEFKVRQRSYPTEVDDAQLRAYGWLLRGLHGLESRQIWLACVSVPPSLSPAIDAASADEKARLIREVCVAPPPSWWRRRFLASHAIAGVTRTRVKSAVMKFDERKSRQELHFLTAYWYGRRRPLPTLKPYKCAACPINAVGGCRSALVAFGTPTPRRRRQAAAG
jgi:glycine cleavage system H lipoate-binding protein